MATKMTIEKNSRDLESFARILEVMSFVDAMPELDEEEMQETTERICELPTSPEHSMSMAEVVFWAGVATGMDVSRGAQSEKIDPGVTEKFLLYSSLFAYSTRHAVVDATLQQMDVEH